MYCFIAVELWKIFKVFKGEGINHIFLIINNFYLIKFYSEFSFIKWALKPHLLRPVFFSNTTKIQNHFF